jgi:hypothetical protein
MAVAAIAPILGRAGQRFIMAIDATQGSRNF